MADMLQMSYSEMENLASAFTTASGELDTLHGNIASFLSDISSKIDEWKNKSTTLSDDATNTQTTLDGIKNNTRSTWQGDAAEKFDSETYPVVYDALTKFNDELDSFAATLATLYSGLESTLNNLNTDVQTGSENCSEDSAWISNYASQHQSIG